MQPRDWSIKMNKKERRLALSTALQSASDCITIIEDVGVSPLFQQFVCMMYLWRGPWGSLPARLCFKIISGLFAPPPISHNRCTRALLSHVVFNRRT